MRCHPPPTVQSFKTAETYAALCTGLVGVDSLQVFSAWGLVVLYDALQLFQLPAHTQGKNRSPVKNPPDSFYRTIQVDLASPSFTERPGPKDAPTLLLLHVPFHPHPGGSSPFAPLGLFRHYPPCRARYPPAFGHSDFAQTLQRFAYTFGSTNRPKP